MIKKNYKSKSVNGQEYKLHRLLMEEALGRPLKDEEVVHHIDENIHNNAIENLQLLPNKAAHTKLHKIGILFTEEHKCKIGAANKGKKRTEEMCETMSIRSKGRKHTIEERERMSRAQWIIPNNPKLTAEDVRDIRKMLQDGVRQFVIAFAFGIKKDAICAINCRKSWKHI